VQYSVDREKCVKYGDRTVKLCNTVWIEKSVLNKGICLYSCAVECG
jgi:hypothetical protein